LLALVFVGVVVHRARSVYPAEIAVHDREAGDEAVAENRPGPACLTVRDPLGAGERGADRPSVRHDHNALVGVPMGELAQGGQDPLAHLLVALAVLPAGPVVEPATELLGKARLDFGAG